MPQSQVEGAAVSAWEGSGTRLFCIHHSAAVTHERNLQTALFKQPLGQIEADFTDGLS